MKGVCVKPYKPTDKQIATAQLIAGKLARPIPTQALESELVMRMWTKSVLGLLSEKEQHNVSPVKRHEHLLAAITWYQNAANSEKLMCPLDGAVLEGEQHFGSVSLRCPCCGFKQRQIPPQIFKQFKEACHGDQPPSEG